MALGYLCLSSMREVVVISSEVQWRRRVKWSKAVASHAEPTALAVVAHRYAAC